MFLSDDDLRELTDKVKASAQARELEHMKIPFRVRRDGSLAVLRAHVESVTSAAATPPSRPRVRFD